VTSAAGAYSRLQIASTPSFILFPSFCPPDLHHGANSPCNDLLYGPLRQAPPDGATYARKVPQRFVVTERPKIPVGYGLVIVSRVLEC